MEDKGGTSISLYGRVDPEAEAVIGGVNPEAVNPEAVNHGKRGVV